MVIRFFQQPPPGPLQAFFSTWLSLVLHVAFLGIFVLASRHQAQDQEFADQIAMFLVPPDHSPGGKGRIQGVAYSAAEDPHALHKRGSGQGPRVVVELPPEAPAAAPPSEAIKEIAADWVDTVATELDVDSTVTRFPESVAPAYPPEMLSHKIEGKAFVRYVVDSMGRADTTSLRVIEASHPDFVTSVRAALPLMRFRPALIGHHHVAQMVQQSFAFRIVVPPKPTSN